MTMQKPAASNKGERPERPQRLTVALAFGFAAGALLAKKPAAALTALATGVLACVTASRKVEAEEEEAMEEADALPLSEAKPVVVNVEPQAPVAIATTESVAFEEMEPMPEMSESSQPAATTAAVELMSLSLPDIDEQPTASADPLLTVEAAAPLETSASEQAPSLRFVAPKPHRELATSISKKRSWLSWFR